MHVPSCTYSDLCNLCFICECVLTYTCRIVCIDFSQQSSHLILRVHVVACDCMYYLVCFVPIDSFDERSYIGTISDIALNATYSAVLSDGGIELHKV